MPVLELVMDSTGMQRGGQQAEAALKGVQDAATKTQASVTAMGGSLRNTFQAVQGVSQVGQGVASTARAFEGANLALGAFAASFTLLEIGKTAKDFRDMSGTVTTTTRDIYGMVSSTTRAATGFEVLGAALKAHPLLTIATAIGAAASLMALFSSNTRSAARSFDDLVASMEKSRLDERVRQLLGAGAGDARRTEMRRLEEAAGYAVSYQPGLLGEGLNVERMQSMLGYGRVDIIRGLAQLGNPYAAEYARTGAYSGEYLPGAGFRQREFGAPSADAGMITLTPDQLRSFIASRYTSLQRGPMYGGGDGGGYFSMIPHQPWGPQDRLGLGIGRDYVSIGDAQQREIDRDNAQAAADRVREGMEAAARYASQIGASLGAAVFDVAAGIQSWQQALASIVQSFARQGLSDLGSRLATSLFNPSPRQTNTAGGWTPSGTPVSFGSGS